MKNAARTPTNAVTANARVGNGVVNPKFCRTHLISSRADGGSIGVAIKKLKILHRGKLWGTDIILERSIKS